MFSLARGFLFPHSHLLFLWRFLFLPFYNSLRFERASLFKSPHDEAVVWLLFRFFAGLDRILKISTIIIKKRDRQYWTNNIYHNFKRNRKKRDFLKDVKVIEFSTWCLLQTGQLFKNAWTWERCLKGSICCCQNMLFCIHVVITEM